MPSVQLSVKFYVILVMEILFVGISIFFTGEQYGVKILIGSAAIAVLFYLLGDARGLVDIIAKLSDYLSSCFPALLLAWFYPRSTRKQRWIIVTVAFVLYFFVLNTTYQELQIDERATRSLQDDLERREENVGTYDFTYASGVLIPFLGICFVSSKEKWKKALFLIGIVIMFSLMLSFQYTIALLGAVIGLITIPILRIKKKVYGIFYVLGAILFLWILPSILSWLSEIVTSEDIAVRLIEMIDFLKEGDLSTANLGGRLEIYGKAIMAFLTHPFTGNRVLTFDSHSTILAVFARLGIWGGIIYISMLVKMKKQTDSVLKVKKEVWKFLPIFVYLIFMALTNPIHSAPTTGVMVWFVTPLAVSLLEQEEEDVIVEN